MKCYPFIRERGKEIRPVDLAQLRRDDQPRPSNLAASGSTNANGLPQEIFGHLVALAHAFPVEAYLSDLYHDARYLAESLNVFTLKDMPERGQAYFMLWAARSCGTEFCNVSDPTIGPSREWWNAGRLQQHRAEYSILVNRWDSDWFDWQIYYLGNTPI